MRVRALVAALLLLGAAGAAHGAVFDVTTTADSGAGSLRAAIATTGASAASAATR